MTEAETEHPPVFSKQLFEILNKDLDANLKSRAAFILMEYVKHQKLRKFALKPLSDSAKKMKNTISDLKAQGKPAKALEVILEKL